ncbi:MAG: hypothetical protein ABI041_03655 [Bdellovibrionia bacterium]
MSCSTFSGVTAQAILLQAGSARAQAVIGFALQTPTMENVPGTKVMMD